MLLSCLAAVSLLWTCSAAVAKAGPAHPCSSAVDPIACALEKAVIGPLPDVCLDIGSGDAVCLEELTCSDIHLKGIPSAYTYPTVYMVGLSGVQAACSGKWVLGDASGKLTASLDDFSSRFGVDFVKGGDGSDIFASNILLNECNITKFDMTIEFSGRDLAVVKLLNSLADSIEVMLGRAISALVCGPLADDVVDILTTIMLDAVNPKLMELINFGPSEPPVLPGCINWHETPLEAIHMLTNLLHTSGDSVQQCLATASSTMRHMKQDVSLPDVAGFLGVSEITVPLSVDIEITPNVSIILNSMTLSGLKSIEDLIILSPVEASDVTLSSSVTVKHLNVSIDAQVVMGGYHEYITLAVELDNSTFLLDLVLGVSQKGLNELYLDQLINIGCWQSLVQVMNITSLLVDIDIKQLAYIQIAGDAGPLEEDVAAMLQNALYLLIDGFPDLVHKSIIGIGQGPLRAAVNSLLLARLDDVASIADCPEHIAFDPENPSWIQWNSSVVIKTLDLFLDTVLGAEGLNSFFGCATGGTGVVKFTPRPEMIITLSGLTSFYDFNVLVPVMFEPYELYNGIGLGYCPPDEGGVCTPFEIDLKFNVEDDPGDLAVSFQNVQMMLGLFLEVDLNEVYNLRFGNWSHQGCKLSTVDDFHLYDFQLSSSSTELQLIGERTRNISTLMNKFFALVTSATTVDKINANLKDYMDNSDYVCTETIDPSSVNGGDDKDTKSINWQLYAMIGGALVTFAVLIYMHYYFTVGNKRSAWSILLSGENVIQARFPDLYMKYNFDDAMICHRDIPLFWRLAVPVIVLGTMALIFSSNMTMAVDVLLEVDIGTQVFKLPPIFSYGLGNTIDDLWQAKVYALSILVAFFSGAWPYVKLFAMLLCWLLPPGILSLSRRETWLEWLDILGKWSILDAYVMCLLMVGFHITVNMEEPITAIVTVLPKYGFYSFVAATMVSLIVGHVALAVHHAIVGNKRSIDTTSALDWTNKPAMCHEFLVPSRQSKIRFTAFGKFAVVFFILLTAFCIVAATMVKTFEVQMRGLIGYLIDVKDDPNTDYSMIDVGIELPYASGEPNNIGVRWIQVSYFAFAVVMPVCLQVSLLLLWVFPLSLKWQQRLFVAAEVFNAWSAMDVFAVSIVAVLLEIQDFASFIVGDSCDSLNVLLADYFDEPLQGEDICFDVTASLLPASWAIYVAAFLMMAVELPILLLCKAILEERLEMYGVSTEKTVCDVCDDAESLLEPLISCGNNCDQIRCDGLEDSVHSIVRIGGSSNSNDSRGEQSANKWIDQGVVVDNNICWNKDCHEDYSHRDVICEADQVSVNGSSGGKPLVTAHGICRTKGKGGSGSSGGSRGAMASVDLTDLPINFDVASNSPPRTNKAGVASASNLVSFASYSQSTRGERYETKSFSSRVIDILKFCRLVTEEPMDEIE